MMQHQDMNRATPSLTTRCVQEAEVETVIALEPKTDPTLWATQSHVCVSRFSSGKNLSK